MSSGLVVYEQARNSLAKCAKVDEAKSIRDKAEAMRAYARQTNDYEMETWAAEIKSRAARRIGEISKGLEKAMPAGGKGKVVLPRSGSTKLETLAKAGLTPQTANRCEKIAEIPESEFEAIIAESRAKQKAVSTKELLAKVKSRVKATKRKSEEAAKARAAKKQGWIVTPRQDVVKCSAVITDPPYGVTSAKWEPKELEAFTRDWASRWATAGADYIAIFWSQKYLFDGRTWFDESLAGYEYVQMLAWHYANSMEQKSRHQFKFSWDPIYLYRKSDSKRRIVVTLPEGKEWGDGINDLDCHVAAIPQSNFNAENAKEHPAQKPVSVMRWLVSALTDEGDIVADPFCGSGTTGIAAVELRRGFHGVEINEDYIALANRRIGAYGQ